MQDVRQQKLLMLLFMMQAEHYQGARFLPCRGARAVDEGHDPPVYGRPIVGNFGAGRSRKDTALRPWMPCAQRVVIRIEEVGVTRIMRRVSAVVSGQNNRLKEPCRMRPVPLRRAGIGHGLYGLIFSRERSGQDLRHAPNLAVPCQEQGPIIGRLL